MKQIICAGIHGCEWKYIGEGGKHALFENLSEGFDGKLLRIEKRCFRVASFCSSHHEQAKDIIEWQRKSRALHYLETYVAPQLAPYVDIPDLVPLQWAFLEALRVATLAAQVVPPSRIKDWNLNSDGALNMKEDVPVGMLVVDYRNVPASMSKNDILVPRRRLCLEVKPKAGYLSRSPLVHPNHRVKLSKSRFSLLQALHQQGHVEKGWAKTAGGIKCSNYEPLDLFSNDQRRMNRAIESLVDSPQNNLKMWYNNRALTKNAILDREAMELVREEVKVCSSKSKVVVGHVQSAFCSLVSDLVVPVLDHETLMGKLQSMQQLDILDVDGAILVSDRLVELCGGSELEAEKRIILSDRIQAEQDPSTRLYPLLSASPFHLPCDGSTVSKLCETTERFQKTLSELDPMLPNCDVLDEFYLEARNLVSYLSLDECVFLLSNWLLSLAMCDVSIFVTFEQLPSLKARVYDQGAPSCRAESQSFVETNSNDGNGVVCIVNEDGTISRFVYILRIIDCDRKPPTKLWGRKEKEAAFAKLEIGKPENISCVT